MRQYIVISPQWLYRYDEIFTTEVISHADFKYDVRIDALNLPNQTTFKPEHQSTTSAGCKKLLHRMTTESQIYQYLL